MSELYASKMVTWTKSQVGYKETGKNVNKYAADMDKNYSDFFNGKKQGQEWCAVFVCDGFCRNYGEANALKMLYLPKKNCAAGCKYAVRYYKAAKAYYKSPKVGDQIFFGKAGKESHTGFVIEVTKTHVVTIEGNKSNSVKKCTYKLGDSKIAGYGRPKYDKEPTPTPTPSPDKKKTVKASQAAESFDESIAGTYEVTRDELNIRDGASKEDKSLGKMVKGDKCHCYGYYTNGWYYVRYETKTTIYEGFASKNYLK